MILKKKAISKRINYGAVESLFGDNPQGILNKKKQLKKKDKTRDKGKAVRDPDAADLSGLERMDTTDDDGMAWANNRAAEGADHATSAFDDGGGYYDYDDDYQQEA